MPDTLRPLPRPLPPLTPPSPSLSPPSALLQRPSLSPSPTPSPPPHAHTACTHTPRSTVAATALQVDQLRSAHVLTIQQPFADGIMQGKKLSESRKWMLSMESDAGRWLFAHSAGKEKPDAEFEQVLARTHCMHAHTACTQHSHCVHIACTPRAHRVYIVCTSHAHRMHTACTPHAHRMHAACKPHARRILNRRLRG